MRTSLLLPGGLKIMMVVALAGLPFSVMAQVECAKFVPQWTYIPGSEVSKSGVYTGSNAFPGTRSNSANCTDAANNHWLFGGDGLDKMGTEGVLGDLWKLDGDTGKWTWVSGTDVAEANGVYTGSQPRPGGRSGATMQVDSNGIIWLFGGYGFPRSGYADRLNDLWRFDPATGQWTWVSGADTIMQKGVYSGAVKYPGARLNPASWIDAEDNLWLFGGQSYEGSDIEYFNDLWKYNTVSNTWEWMSGKDSANWSGTYTGANPTPGSRNSVGSWIDNFGKLWVFGGYGYPKSGFPGPLNDMWCYDPQAGKWSWEGGADARRDQGNYTGPDFYPASRYQPGVQKDSNGNVWLFGGTGYVSSTSQNLNDFWKLNGSTGRWEWLGGANIGGLPSNFSEESPYPGGRLQTSLWVNTSNDSLWLFGGFVNGGIRNNELWKVNLQSYNYTTTKNTARSFVPSVKNPQGSGQVNIAVTPAHGTAVLANGTTDTITYTPESGFLGSDSFLIELSSGPCGVSISPVNITVENELTDLNLDGNITPMDKDSDGDGFPDAIEELLGTSISDYNQTPTGSIDTGFNTFSLGTKALKLKPNKKTQLEKVKLKSMLPASSASMAGANVAVNLGGNTMLFTLDAKGKAAIGKNKLAMKLKKGKKGAPDSLQFTLAMEGQFKNHFRPNGPVDGNNNPTRVTLDVYFDGGLYSGTQPVLYK